jgi:hypothetical protein
LAYLSAFSFPVVPVVWNKHKYDIFFVRINITCFEDGFLSANKVLSTNKDSLIISMSFGSKV